MGFRVEVTEGEMVRVGEYSQSWGVRDVEVFENIAVLAGRRALETVDLTDPRSPVLMDRKKLAKAALEVALRGSKAVKARSRLLVGLNCSKADEVVVFDIQDRAEPLQKGEYDAEAHPWIFARATRDMFVLPKGSGFEVYRMNPRK